MANPIYRSQYTAAQIEGLITHGTPIIQNGTWWTWDVSTQQYVDTGVTADSETAAAEAAAAQEAAELAQEKAEDAQEAAEAAAADAETLVSAAVDVYKAFPTESASGAVASTEVGADAVPLKNLVVQITPVQAAGTPTLINPIPISGWTGANIVVSPTQDAQDGTTYTVDWTSEAGTVYGGTLDVLSGVLTIERAMRDIGGISSITYDSANHYFVITKSTIVPNAKSGTTNPIVSSAFTKAGSGADYTVTETNGQIRLFDSNYTSKSAFLSAYSGQSIVYMLSTPTTVQLTPTEVKSLLGENNVWADAGEVSVSFRCDPTRYIDARIAALEGN